MRRTAEQAEETRIALIEAAVLVLADVGYHAARLDEVASRAGVTRGAVYHHFGDKRGILRAIIARYIGAFDQSIDDVVQASSDRGSVATTMERLIVEPLALVESDRHAAAFFELVMLRAAGVRELNEVRAQRRELIAARVGALSATLIAAAQSGRIRNDIDAEAIARHVASVHYGILATWIEFDRAYSLVDAGLTAARLLVDAIERRPRSGRNV